MSQLSDYFRSQAEWREAKADEYPDDERNAQSASALRSLAEFVQRDEDGWHYVDALEPHLFEQFSLGGEQTAREVSRYGFGYRVTNSQHEEFLEELAALCVSDAYETVRDKADDDDWTGSLLPFELDAARAGVALPLRYFQRRGGSTEAELEEAVTSYSTDGSRS